ncbi:MAG: hypothetical protein AAGB46_13420 [Verrucomicrobiota bacterium]
MKKLVLLVIAFAISGSFAFGQERERRLPDIDKQLERIENALADEDISDRKKAFLEDKKELLTLQQSFRDAVRAAVEDLGEEATVDDIRAAKRGVREDFADDFRAYKESRREAARERREARRDAAEEG